MSHDPHDLDGQRSSYHAGFRFFDENARALTWYAERLVGCLARRDCRSALSLGIGQRIVGGRLIEATLAGRLERYMIVEGSATAIEELRADAVDLSKTELVESWFERFSTEARFDLIEMGFVLEHVDEPRAIVERFRAFLNPGGVCAIAVPNARSLHRLIGFEAGLLDDVYRLSSEDLALGHQRYFDLESLRSLVTAAKLDIEVEEGILIKPITSGQLKALDLPPEVYRGLFEVAVELPAISNSIYMEAVRP